VKYAYLFFLTYLLSAACVHDTTQAPLTCSPDHPVSWSKDIKALIETKCSIPGCHTANSTTQLRLATYEQVQASQGDVRGQVFNRNMPRGTALSDKEIFLITCWIDQGARDN
jgi:hypothetical protein